MSKNKQHTVYKLIDGTRVPGTTSITGELGWNKQVLVTWANRLGLEGKDAGKYKDDKAEIGKLAHAICTSHFTKEVIDYENYTPEQKDKAENCALSFFEWMKGKDIEPIYLNKEMLIEKPLVSELHRFGGTPDLPLRVNGINTLIDLKTGKGIYPEYSIQVGGGYKILLDEYNVPIQQVMILNIPRTEDESFEQKIITPEKIEICKRIFLHALEIYKDHKLLTKE